MTTVGKVELFWLPSEINDQEKELFHQHYRPAMESLILEPAPSVIESLQGNGEANSPIGSLISASYENGRRLTPLQRSKRWVNLVGIAVLLLTAGALVTGLICIKAVALTTFAAPLLLITGVAILTLNNRSRKPDLDHPKERRHLIEQIAKMRFDQIAESYAFDKLSGYRLLNGLFKSLQTSGDEAVLYACFITLIPALEAIKKVNSNIKERIEWEYNQAILPHFDRLKQQESESDLNSNKGHALSPLFPSGEDFSGERKRGNVVGFLAGINGVAESVRRDAARAEFEARTAPATHLKERSDRQAQLIYQTLIARLDQIFRNSILQNRHETTNLLPYSP